MQIFNRDIRFKTFFKKGLPRMDDRFGVYFVAGKQRTGKSYFAISLTLQQLNYNFSTKKINPIYNFKVKTNIHSLHIPNVPIEYFDKISDIYFDTEPYVIYIIDEMSRKYDKNSKTDTQFYAFLNQCGKMHRVCIMITQEWKELPMWIRRPVKFCITTSPAGVLNRFGIYKSIVGDAENMELDKDSMEWICPPIKYIYYKRNYDIASMYDTFEAINQL